MKRRKFIGTLVLAGISISFLSYLFIDNFKNIVKKILEKDTEKLAVENSVIEQFIADAEKELYFNQFSTVKRIIIIIHFKLNSISRLIPLHSKYYQYRSAITGQFLLSTNLFDSHDPDYKNLKYIFFFNPYKLACSSKFSNLFYPTL